MYMNEWCYIQECNILLIMGQLHIYDTNTLVCDSDGFSVFMCKLTFPHYQSATHATQIES